MFPANVRNIRSASVIASALLLASCSPQDQASFRSSLESLRQVGNSPTPVVMAAPIPGPGINETPLSHIFLRAPYDTQKPPTNQYPRVALTITAAPADATVMWQRQESQGYWLLTARIWRSASQFEDVGPFSIQIQRDAPTSTLTTRDVTAWRNFVPTAFALGQGSTGDKRTIGPTPPTEAIPNDIAHKRYFTGGGQPFGFQMSNNELMLSVALYAMDFNTDILQDRRIWIVKFLPAEAG